MGGRPCRTVSVGSLPLPTTHNVCIGVLGQSQRRFTEGTRVEGLLGQRDTAWLHGWPIASGLSNSPASGEEGVMDPF